MCISGIQCCPDETSCSRLWEEKCVRPFFAFWLPFKCSRHFFHDPTCCSLTVCDTAPFVQTAIMTNRALYVSHLSVLVAHPYIFMLRANPFLFSVTTSRNNKKIIRRQRSQQIFSSPWTTRCSACLPSLTSEHRHSVSKPTITRNLAFLDRCSFFMYYNTPNT